MGEPLSPDRVFDFSMDEPELHPADDGPDDDEDDEEVWEVNEEWFVITVFLMKAEKLTSVDYFAYKRFRFNQKFDGILSS
nr:hypothetical protein [Tanacetum cinerariifolium]